MYVVYCTPLGVQLSTGVSVRLRGSGRHGHGGRRKGGVNMTPQHTKKQDAFLAKLKMWHTTDKSPLPPGVQRPAFLKSRFGAYKTGTFAYHIFM